MSYCLRSNTLVAESAVREETKKIRVDERGRGEPNARRKHEACTGLGGGRRTYYSLRPRNCDASGALEILMLQ